jgi:hypothetical protein
VRFKVVSEEWCAAVDVARPPRVELRPRSMSQSDLGEVLSRSFRIQRFFRWLGCLVSQRYFGEESCMAVALSVWCLGLLYWLLLTYGRSWEIGDRVCVI